MGPRDCRPNSIGSICCHVWLNSCRALLMQTNDQKSKQWSVADRPTAPCGSVTNRPRRSSSLLFISQLSAPRAGKGLACRGTGTILLSFASKNGSHDRNHAPYRDSLSSIGGDLLWSTLTRNLKSLHSPITEIWKETKNVKIGVVLGG